ncbi:ABC transporter permease [Robertkochia aurantiaca]|uniref:ABC transporter permease n=1 Tax=Robertkochia aurantiaca TaxID=2873700 RepID=UPI001CCF2DAF|nr:ABC transporter permease [Robertkochia sp. 3YJGBD-33]
MMRSLLWAETYKLFKQERTWYAVVAIFIIEVIVLIGAYYQGSNIIDILLDNLKESFYFEGELLNGNLLIYLILNSMWFNFPLILMIVISGLLTTEYKDNTLQAILLQPVSKRKLIQAKYIIATLFTVAMVLFLCVSAFALSYLFFGFGDLVVYLDELNFFTHQEARNRLISAFIAGMFPMVFYSLSSLTIAVFLKDTLKTWIVSVLFLIISNVLLKFDFKVSVLNRFFFAKLNDTWQYFFLYEIPHLKIWVNCLVLSLYIAALSFIGIRTFIKNDIG